MSMISELVKKLRNKSYSPMFSPEFRGLLAQAADTIETLSVKLQTANADSGWIPCEERMPDIAINKMYSDDMLVAEKWDDGNIIYDIAWYNASGSWSADSSNRKVIAWRPLPEPYREVRDETD